MRISHLLKVLPAFLIFLFFGAAPQVSAADSENVVLIANVDDYGAYSDVWGYTSPNGTEIAIIGLDFGTSFIDVTDVNNPVEVLLVPGNFSIWRDIKTYGHYAYIVDDQAGDGLIVVDLDVPTAPTVVGTYTNNFTRAHNVWIDADLGLLFAGYDQFGDLYVLDVDANPANPPLVYVHSAFLTHDMYSRDGIGYMAAIFDGRLRTVDLTQLPGGMPQLDSQATDNDAAHNVWLTDDGNYALMTDEVSGGHITVIDVSDPGDLSVVGNYTHPEDPDAIIHNVIVEGDIAYVSWYRAGLEVIDVSNPLSLSRLGYYDTFPGTGDGFDGAWGVYPFAESGYLYVSDIQSGLYVLQYDGTFGSIEGTITDAVSSNPIEAVEFSVPSAGRIAETDGTGFYSLTLTDGPYLASVSAFGYQTTDFAFDVLEGVVTNGDLQLTPIPNGAVSGDVVASDGGAPLIGAEVEIIGTPLLTVTNAGGSYLFPQVPAGPIVLRVKSPGYGRKIAAAVVPDGVPVVADFVLDPSLVYHDLESDPGWTIGDVGDDAVAGLWTRVDPNGTGEPNGSVQPEDDRTADPGVNCFITGQQTVGGSIGSNDVDGGSTTLRTAVYDLTSLTGPVARFYFWYSNTAGSNPAADEFLVEISEDGGANWTNVATISETFPLWQEFEVSLEELSALDQIQFRFIAADEGGASVVEAGIDEFEIFGTEQVASIPELADRPAGPLFLPSVPNPFESGGEGAIRFRLEEASDILVDIMDVRGRRVVRLEQGRWAVGVHHIQWNLRDAKGAAIRRGIYFARLQAGAESSATKIIVQ